MRGTLIVLAAVLIGQCVLAAALYLGLGSEASERTRGPLVTYKTDAVDAIRITGANGKTVRIKRSSDGWVLSQSGGFPAASSKVQRLLDNMSHFGDKLPVALSESARKRFSVGSGNFERRVKVMVNGEAAATLFLGDAAGPGQVYARAVGEDMIYEVEFALHRVAADTAEWRDQSVAIVPMRKVRKISMPDFTLRRIGKNSWKLVHNGAESGSSVDAGKVRKWLRRLARPDFQSVGKGKSPETEPKLAYTLVTKAGKKIHFAFYGSGESGEPARFYRDGQPWEYRISGQQIARLKKLSARQLLASDDSKGTAAGTAKAQSDGQKTGSAS